MEETIVWAGSPSQLVNFPKYLLCAVLTATVVGAIVGLPWALVIYLKTRCIHYELTNQRLRIRTGVFSRATEEIELYRVRDSKLVQPFWLRLFSLGNVLVISIDVTTPSTTLHAIRDAESVRERMRSLIEDRRDAKRVREIELG